MTTNIPTIKVGIVAVSRDCFPAPLAVNRRKALVQAYTDKYGADDIYECPVTIVESETDMVNALEDVRAHGCNALCVYLGNFGPEIAETLLAKHFDGPKMFWASPDAAMRSAACSMPAITWHCGTRPHGFRSIRSVMQKTARI